VQIQHLSENSFGSLAPARAYMAVKHLGDFLFAAVLLPLALPAMLACATAIRIGDGRPVLFRQKRVGRGGREFTVYKFRTMRLVGDLDPNDRRAAMTGEDDVRITRLGGFLRRARLDELPQLWNIIRGEMSFIGPRPEAQILSSWYTKEIPFYRYRHVVRPGISGWAQVNQGHVAEVEEVHRKLQYDFFYVKYFSPWLDVLILFKTVKTMLSGFGAR
jgi:lipopolysaccharide/colanic/teichoic acid biosynthesis glycosyltransferase